MNQKPITTAEYNALTEEKKALYGDEVKELLCGFPQIWQECTSAHLWKHSHAPHRIVHYPKPVASQQPTQQTAPLINEGGGTVGTHENDNNVALLKKDDFRNEVFDIMSDSESGYYSTVDKATAANQIADLYHAQITTLQTALAEANNKIAEIEVQINAQKRQLKQQDKHKRMIKGLWLSMCEENKILKDAVKDYFDSGCQVRIDSFEEFISQYVIED